MDNVLRKMQDLRDESDETVGIDLWRHGGVTLWYGRGDKTSFARYDEAAIMERLDELMERRGPSGHPVTETERSV